jgi:homeobox protein cut-like
VKLYEKIRFLQSFPKGASNSHLESYHKQNGGRSGGAGEHDEEALSKYTNDYEKKLDPFSKFTYREKQKRYSNLKLHDKFTLNFAGFILSSRTARLVFFAYFLIIHLLIFGSMYWIAHKDATHRDYSVECAQNFRDHMFKVHGEKSFQPSHSHHK